MSTEVPFHSRSQIFGCIEPPTTEILFMGASKKYFIRVDTGTPLGPFTRERVRWWIAIRVIQQDWQVCLEGERTWSAVAGTPLINELPESQEAKLREYHSRKLSTWELEPASSAQLQKLKFLLLPFEEANLTKGRASELIECFVMLNPTRSAEYDNRPAQQKQLEKIRRLGGCTDNLTYRKAKETIEELEDLDAERKQEQEDEIADVMYCVNESSDWREEFNYRKINKSQARRLLEHLKKTRNDWQDATTSEKCELVLLLFPEQLKQPRSSSARKQKRNGCCILFLPFLALIAYILLA